MPKTTQATLMLVGVTFLWGFSFPLMKEWHDTAADCPGGRALATFTLIGLRYVLALFILLLFAPGLVTGATPREHSIGIIIGTTYLVGSTFQVLGLIATTPALSAFITSLGSA